MPLVSHLAPTENDPARFVSQFAPTENDPARLVSHLAPTENDLRGSGTCWSGSYPPFRSQKSVSVAPHEGGLGLESAISAWDLNLC
jgi:hypothetical protein